MPEEIVMPRLSDSMEEGTILTWLKGVGDRVEVGEELVEIETDKANMVFESDVAGQITELTASEGDTVALGEVIARVGEPGEAPAGAEDGGPEPEQDAQAKESEQAPDEDRGQEAASDEKEKAEGDGEADDARAGRSAVQARESPRVHAAEAAPDAAASPDAEPDTAEGGPKPEAPPADGDGRIKASPLARRIASERGIDLAALSGSGPGGRIIKADVEAAPAPAEAPEAGAAPAPPPTPAGGGPEAAKGEVKTVEPNRLQRTVARRMAESKATVPHFYLQAEVEMSRCVEARARLKDPDGRAPFSLNDMVLKAAATALREHPRANGAYRDGHFELYERVNVGLAVAGADALVVPTIFDADQKGLAEIGAEARALAARVREGKITPPELSGGTFTVSNLGMYGVTNFHPVINPPQAAILAVGEVAERPVLRDGELAAAQLMGVTLACDHRILYGAEAAQFLARVRALLEEPVGLAL
jgi:pyruvate dehydrogenase E2 component (dihydrolipoamide acetyltransferase)